MGVFSPTYLYVKQHTTTGLKYFGKTTKDPEEYLGSGKYWLRHINIHGKQHVVNLWYKLFTNEDEMVDFALKFSSDNQIVESEEWANLMPENGLTGGVKGMKHSPEHIKHLTETNRRNAHLMTGSRNPAKRAEVRAKLSNATTGRTRPDLVAYNQSRELHMKECPHCHKVVDMCNYSRWHGDNCKSKN